MCAENEAERDPQYLFHAPPWLAKRHGRSVTALAVDRCKGIGPPYHKLEGKIRYCVADVLEYESSRRIVPGE